MKEALTKALGVGLGLDFNSFESHLVEVDIIVSDDNDADALNEEVKTSITDALDNKHGDGGIWDYINHRYDQKETMNQEDIQTPGSVHLPALVRRSFDKEGKVKYRILYLSLFVMKRTMYRSLVVHIHVLDREWKRSMIQTQL